jgi:hypothetical protein
MKSIIFWDMTPCSLLSCNRHFRGTYRLHLQGHSACLLVFAEIISSTLKMEAICSPETSVATQQTTWHHIPEDDTLHNHHCENLKSYMHSFKIFLSLVFKSTVQNYTEQKRLKKCLSAEQTIWHNEIQNE